MKKLFLFVLIALATNTFAEDFPVEFLIANDIAVADTAAVVIPQKLILKPPQVTKVNGYFTAYLICTDSDETTDVKLTFQVYSPASQSYVDVRDDAGALNNLIIESSNDMNSTVEDGECIASFSPPVTTGLQFTLTGVGSNPTETTCDLWVVAE